MGAAEALGDAVQHKLCCAFRVGNNLRIPETHDPPANAFQMFGSRGIIALLIEMLAAVEFDREFGLAAGEVDDVVSCDELPCECRSVARQ